MIVLTKRFLFFIAAFLALMTCHAQAGYPEKPLTLVVPLAAGGTTDILARIIAQPLSEKLGQSVVVDNRSGAGGSIGAELVAKSPPDGYTLLMGTSGPLSINSSLYEKIGYDPLRDFVPPSSTPNLEFLPFQLVSLFEINKLRAP